MYCANYFILAKRGTICTTLQVTLETGGYSSLSDYRTMPKTVSHASTTFSEENIQIAKNELLDLHRQLKKVESEHKAYCVHTQQLLWKQSKVIEDLEREKAEISLIMGLTHSESVTKKDNLCRIELSGLLETQDQCRKEIDNCRVKLRLLDGETRLSNKKMQHQRREMIVVHKSRDKAAKNQKKTALLENRLNHGNVKYSELLKMNCDVRERIDSMLKLRSRFNTAYVRIKKLMKAGKRKIMATIQDATLAYHQRDETQYRIHILRERSRADQVQLAEQIKDLHRMVEHDENMKTFMDRKGKDRISEASDKKLDFLIKEANGEHGSNDRLKLCRDIFAKITAVSNAKDVKTIILRFRQVEDKNFALFNYITELNNDSEKLQDVVQLCHEEIDELQNKYREQHRKEFQDYQDLEAQADVVKKEVLSTQGAVDLQSRILEQVKKEVNKLLEITKLTEANGDSLTRKEGIMDHNVIQHLGILEEGIIELLELHKFRQCKLREEAPPDETSVQSTASSEIISVPQPPQTWSTKDIAPPELGDNIKFSEDINLSDTPLSTTKLRAFAYNNLQKKHLSVTTESKSRKSHKQKKATKEN